MFTVTHINGAMEPGEEAMLPQLLEELAHADREHTDVSVQHESGWTLSIFPSRRVVLENVESDEMPRSAQMATDGDCLRAMGAVASGSLNELNYATWQEGYGSD
jgi:hypothetical protein